MNPKELEDFSIILQGTINKYWPAATGKETLVLVKMAELKIIIEDYLKSIKP